MAFDITPYVDKTPAEVRELIREGVIDFPTAGMVSGIRPGEPGDPAAGVCGRF